MRRAMPRADIDDAARRPVSAAAGAGGVVSDIRTGASYAATSTGCTAVASGAVAAAVAGSRLPDAWFDGLSELPCFLGALDPPVDFGAAASFALSETADGGTLGGAGGAVVAEALATGSAVAAFLSLRPLSSDLPGGAPWPLDCELAAKTGVPPAIAPTTSATASA
ncbi:MAG: hypothetical protein H0W96_10400 [Solirubrobacterales bacterium]|nr:hypothetical protein [Solirubrobacterales bacterium]